jgi:glycosyltransferase involved in cell wall biosynthesis
MGDGPNRADLVKQAKDNQLDNVTFLEPRPAAEVPPFLASADIVLVPLGTHLPGATPSKLYEAMASGRPVVLVAEGEPAKIVQEQEAGLVVRPGDEQGLVAALRTLAGDPALRDRLGANGRRAAERYFNRSEIADRFVEYLEELHATRLRTVSLRPAARGEAS